jgi:hypothetical protein
LTRPGRSVFASCEHQNFLKCLPGFHGPRCCQRHLLRPGCPSTPVPTLIGCEFLKNRPARTDHREPPAEKRDYTSKRGPVNTPSTDSPPDDAAGPRRRGSPAAATRLRERGLARRPARPQIQHLAGGREKIFI